MFTRPRKFLLETALDWALILFLVVIMEVACCALSHAQKTSQSGVAVNMNIIADIESGSEPLAYNAKTGAVGEFQLMQPVVSDYNNRGAQSTGDTLGHPFVLEEMYDPFSSLLVANWYMNIKIPAYLYEFNIPDNVTARLIAYNWGIGHLHKWFRQGAHWSALPLETRKYIKKYFKELSL